MKKLIPFRKEIPFENNLYEITSISLEHSLHKEKEEIKGNFIVSGEYRITETSVNTEKFNYDLPFSIDVVDKYNIDNVDIDINDFYYEILDSRSLVINIEVKLDNLEEKVMEDDDILNEDNNQELVDDNRNELLEEELEFDPISEPVKEHVLDSSPNDNHNRCIEEEVTSLFSNMSDDNYVTYRVYIVRENDTMDSIMTKYNISREELEKYNNIDNLKIGDKVIIPYVKN